MILSMTGFGRYSYEYADKNYTLELKSLNSRNLDVNTRIPLAYRSKELEIRKLINNTVVRGKVDFSMQIESLEGNKPYSINIKVVNSYLDDLFALSPEAKQEDLLAIAMRMPEVLSQTDSDIEDDEWEYFEKGFKEMFALFLDYRKEEGNSLAQDLKKQANSIAILLKEVEQYAPERIELIKEKFKQSLEELNTEYDEQRYHQELMYYIEKYDITEELVRLTQHLQYFEDTINEEGIEKGKKLAFIAQEMGREINTIGSKANHVSIQQLVIQMKEALEKIKEQSFNVL